MSYEVGILGSIKILFAQSVICCKIFIKVFHLQIMHNTLLKAGKLSSLGFQRVPQLAPPVTVKLISLKRVLV